jgi:Tryptophan-rich sensory protein (mitochondrial benzodiazepine receptor homolog)
MKNRSSLFLFIIAVLAAGLAIGYLTPPDEWYASLDKPWFNPPGWLFAPVWSILYVLIAIAGWRVFTFTRDVGLKVLWAGQMALNFLWSPAFFAAHNPGLALAIIVILLIAILAFILRAWNRDRTASILFLPYAAWVAFATMLNLAIVQLN